MKNWRPPIWETVEELEEKIEQYFEYVTQKDDKGRFMEIPDIEWLAFFLNTTRKTILDYEKKEDFSNTIKKAKDKIFFYKKQLAMMNQINPTVFIFDSKNNHWYVDKTEVDNTHKITDYTFTSNLEDDDNSTG